MDGKRGGAEPDRSGKRRADRLFVALVWNRRRAGTRHKARGGASDDWDTITRKIAG